ncbi:25-hydroxyvitamin D-1 alpha hydroxylase, mitochondrial [Oenanthe melanoleuca]|uniref:25-hydroxyvitamin D-1 alpha hydroxylase, mitochondrial n=1 Tax=Oenanthe melanoleuca TaxID=2939378 RepID=UPI0024C11D57|nr:25-hydroxyvitamin D-1 alpha hydroxylase, mitochondrial [Oenanthe melanoleuca]
MSPRPRLPALLGPSLPGPGVPRAPPAPAAAPPPARTPHPPRGAPEPARLRGLAEMPGPSSAAFIFELLCRGGVRRLHEMQVHGRARFGPLWKARFGPVLTVHVAEPALVAQVLRQEGPEPRRALSCPWKEHRSLRGVPGGLLTLEGEAWRGSRRVLARGLLRPGAAETFAGPVATAVAELVARLQRLQRQHPRGIVPDIGTEFNRFGLEAISWVLFSSRLGCLGDAGEATAATEGVIRCVGAVLALTLVTMALPRPLLRLFPAPWDAFCHAWDQLFAFAKGHVDRRVAAVAARGPLAEGDTCVTDLLARERVPASSIYGNVTELLLAGVDTVASTLAWSLYELARNPGAQAALHRELVAATATSRDSGGDSATTGSATAAATATALARLPLLRAVVKETLRLYPVIPANARVVSNCDIRVGDYLVPRQTLITLCHYATSRDSRSFPAPDAFRPERWLRPRDSGDTAGDTAGDSPGDTAGDSPGDSPRHPFASLPFGLGPRSCVGRRLAELQLHMALAQILLRFEVRPEPGGGRVRPMTRTLLAPGAPISLRFLRR